MSKRKLTYVIDSKEADEVMELFFEEKTKRYEQRLRKKQSLERTYRYYIREVKRQNRELQQQWEDQQQ